MRSAAMLWIFGGEECGLQPTVAPLAQRLLLSGPLGQWPVARTRSPRVESDGCGALALLARPLGPGRAPAHHAPPPALAGPRGQPLLSPSPIPHGGGGSGGGAFSRWSTSRLCGGSATTSASTSPGGSARSSFNYRQPYLGWRSQERLARPRTPAERLAAGLLADKQAAATPQVPNLSEVRTSIKEVTSAIVHYVSGVRDDGSSEALTAPQRHDSSISPRSTSPRGSGRLCWVESSFVGSRPLDSPETPLSLTGSDPTTKMGDLYLELNKSQGFSQLNGEPQLVM
ncbi:Uncharacterized protein GBIM_12126 [Gryllus bimaculatus]|nr:Uncharacterized protein GBIM_12126 [Gryllus bimaculatus]